MNSSQTPMTIPELKQMAAAIRCDIIEMITTANAGHPGGSLSAADIEKHVSVIFPQIDIPFGFIRDLLDVTRGNPLFVQEILRKMISEQKIVQSGNRWKIIKLEKGYFPKSLEDIIRNKILALDGDSRRFLHCVSAFGESISLSMLTGVSDEKSAMVHEFLNRIIDQVPPERVKEAHLTIDMVKPTVDRMRSKPGADISQAEADTLYDYLSKYFIIPPSPPVVPGPPLR